MTSMIIISGMPKPNIVPPLQQVYIFLYTISLSQKKIKRGDMGLEPSAWMAEYSNCI